MAVVHGSNTVFSIYIIDGFYPVLCGTDMTFEVQSEMIEKTGPGSPGFKEFVPRLSDWTATVTGLTPVLVGSPISWFYLLQESVRRVKQQIQLQFTDQEGNIKQITGYAYISLMNINGPQTDFSSAGITFKGTGNFDTETIVIPPLNFEYLSDWWTTSNGNSFINGASAVNFYTLTTGDVVLEVDVEGVEHDIVTGSPGNREAQPVVGSHRVNFNTTFDGSQRVFVLFKRPV